MSSNELMRVLPIPNKRMIQEIIAKERESGKVILSTTQKGGGYYLPEKREEVTEFINTLSKRAGNTFKALKSAKAFVYGSLTENRFLSSTLAQMFPPEDNYFNLVSLKEL